MPRQIARLDPEASEYARKLHAYMLAKHLAVKPWCTKAGVAPSALFNLFAGGSGELDTATIRKLASVSGPSLFSALEIAPAPKGELDLDMSTAQKVTELLQAILDTQKDIHEEQRVIRAQNAEIIKRLGGEDTHEAVPRQPDTARPSKPS